MASSGYLVPTKEDATKEALWNETWKRIDRFMPELKADLALDDPAREDGQAPTVPNQDSQPGNTGSDSKEG